MNIVQGLKEAGTCCMPAVGGSETSIQHAVAAGSSRWLLPLIVLICTVSASVFLWRQEAVRAEEQSRVGLADDFHSAVGHLRDRFVECEDVLRVGLTSMGSDQDVTRDSWRRFVEGVDLSGLPPGVIGLSYVSVVPDAGLDSFVQRMRESGVPGFHRHGWRGADDSGVVDPHYIVQFDEPGPGPGPGAADQSKLGLDFAVSAKSREAFDDSMESGVMRMTRVYRLSAGREPDKALYGVSMLLPVYRGDGEPATAEQRRDGIRGWVALSLNLDTFLASWWEQYGRGAGVAIHDNRHSNVRHDLYMWDRREAHRDAPVHVVIGMRIGGREWVIDSHGNEPIRSDYATANMTLLIGVFISLLISGIMWSLTHTRTRAVRLAESMTIHLRESEERQRVLAEDAAEANRMKSLFLANMSHDVRTPMTAILGYTRLLEEELGDRATPMSTEAMTAIRRSGDHLLGLINDVLDLSKIEAGRLDMMRTPVDVAELIEGCVGIVRQTAEAKRIELRVSIETTIPACIRGDATRLRQILLNLLGNAVKFTERGRVSLTIWGACDESGDLCFEIEDTGIGMSETELSRVFDPFVQADVSHTRVYGGTGLGLTIVGHLVEQMGGTLEAESTQGVGSRFVIRLPVEPIGDDVIEDHCQLTGRLGTVPDDRSWAVVRMSGRVLLAEDGPDNQRLITHILGRAGVTLDIVGDGLSALSAVEGAESNSLRYDVILLDMQLPGLDGYGVVRTLRGGGYSGRVVALTAHAMAGDREKCLSAGCDDYLSKPFDPADLVAVVGRAVMGEKAA